MTSFIPLLIVTSLYEVFIEVMEYDDTFHTFSHCDLTVWSICWGDGVWWHFSYLCSLWPHCMKYLLKGWSTMTPFIPLLIVNSLYEVFIKVMEYDNTFHISAHCDLTVWGICGGNGVRWHLSHLFSLWPHCMKYLLIGWSLMTFFIPLLIVTSQYEVFVEGWSMMTPFKPLLIVTSLYEVFVDGMEYDDNFHTYPHCALIVWSICWGDGVRWHLSYLSSLRPHSMKYLLRGWSTMTPFIPLPIVTSLTEVFIEGMEYDDTFHTSAHCDLPVCSMYWVDRVRWHF
jgi:uncharacterized protein YbdZ (MbtH family)